MEIHYEEEDDNPSSVSKRRDTKLDSKQDEQLKNDDNISTTEDTSVMKEQNKPILQCKNEVAESIPKKKLKEAKKHDRHKGDKADKKTKNAPGIIQCNILLLFSHELLIFSFSQWSN